MKILVIGLESSGTRWMRDTLNKHPEIDASSVSFPCYIGENRRYPEEVTDVQALIVMCRDTTCQQKSVERAGYNVGNEGKFSREESVVKLTKFMPHLRRIYVSYEGMITYGKDYLYWLLRELGVSEYYEVPLDVNDGNLRYLNANVDTTNYSALTSKWGKQVDMLMDQKKDFVDRGYSSSLIQLWDTVANVINDCRKELEEAISPSYSVWIDASTTFPPPGSYVLTHGPYGFVVAQLDKDGKWWAQYADNETGDPWLPDGPPTHWMPLPSDPNAERTCASPQNKQDASGG